RWPDGRGMPGQMRADWVAGWRGIRTHRKFIRTELTERGCPSEALAAFMGHWLRGEEPQDAYSTFCPAVYAKVLDEWITPLLRELGWSALSSQWVTE
ncbi:hypothetical protein QOT38_30325, partial [Pseudomonas aeruginosa]